MNILSLLTLFGGSAPYIDITPGDYPELHEEAACDKHRELVNAAQIEALQRRIVERGGKVTVAQHVERLKEREPQ